MTEGFAPSIALGEVPAAARAARMGVPVTSHVAGTAGHVPAHPSAIAGRGVAVAHGRGGKPSAARAGDVEEAKAAALGSIKSRLMLPVQVEGFAIMGGMLSGLVGMVLPATLMAKITNSRVALAASAVLTAPARALRETAIGDVFRLPANYLHELRKNAAAANRSNWESGAGAKAEKLMQMGQRAESATVRVLKPVGNAVGGTLDRFGGSAVGKPVQQLFGKFSTWRLNRATARHDVHMNRAMAAATQEGQGFFNRIKNSVLPRSPVAVAEGELAPFMSKVRAANGLTGMAKADALKAVAEEMKALTLEGEAGHRASAVAKHLGRAAGRAQAVEHWGMAAGGTLKTMLTTAAKVAGGVPILYAMVGAAAAAGLGALAMKSHAAGKRSNAAYAEVTANIVDPQSGFARVLKASLTGQKLWNVTGNTVHAVGEVLDSAMWAAPHSTNMAALMIPQMATSGYDMVMSAHAPEALKNLPTLVNDNPLLNACALLSAGDRGDTTLNDTQRAYLIRQVIGAIPTVAAQGGVYNRLNAAMSQEMVTRGMKMPEIVRMVSDDRALNAFGAEMAEKAKPAAKAVAPVATTQENHAAIHAPANAAEGHKVEAHREANAHAVPASTAAARYAAAEKPATMVAANDVGGARAHHGTIASHQRMVG